MKDGEGMNVTENDLERTARLSRLAIPADEKEDALARLGDFLSYVDNLSGVDTEGVQPTTYALPIENVFRADEVCPSLPNEAALSNAPLQEDGYFKVPKVLEG
ncbi:aspartyl/glutamyl-tRNA(Asn/Gln) amidotransferase, C subunit [Selenomonas sp. F0473]|nr:aspartyl/glutamyl-tRNA(Asn/Gln) amidotransferase, C subunit [Selenomonas sp. F0473]